MTFYKRGQLEDALSKLVDPHAKEPTSELCTRIKRLLEVDRSEGIVSRSSDPIRATFAFFGEKPRGSGNEVWFSAYEAFALLNGLRLLGHGWPQSIAVTIMRRIRGDLELEHSRILKLNPEALLDQTVLQREAKEGGTAVSNTDPTFLTIVMRPGEKPDQRGMPKSCSVHRGVQNATEWARRESGQLGSFAMFELAGPAHFLARRLAATEPRRRGPAG